MLAGFRKPRERYCGHGRGQVNTGRWFDHARGVCWNRGFAGNRAAVGRYKLLALDLDGTLLDSQNRVSAANRDALHRAQLDGLRLCVCTGRCYTETRSIIEQIGLHLDHLVLACGAIVAEARSGRTLYCQPLIDRMATDICRFFLDREQSSCVLHDRFSAGFDYSLVRGRQYHPGFDRWFASVPVEVREAASPDTWPAPPVRVTIIDSVETLAALSVESGERFGPAVAKMNALHLPVYDLFVLEFFAPAVDKWQGVRRLCQHYGIVASEVAAIGDAVNDVELIAGAGLGVAVANACPQVLAVAGVVVGSNDADGVAEAVAAILNGVM